MKNDIIQSTSRWMIISRVVGVALMLLLVSDLGARTFFHVRLLSQWDVESVLLLTIVYVAIALHFKRRAETERRRNEEESR